MTLEKWDAMIAPALGGLALFFYGRTVTPGLLSGDGGEFQTLAYLLGNTHPTGYPVYLALARLFTLLPLGEPAYRVNLFSAVLGAIAVSGIFLCGKLLTGYWATSAAGGIALAVSATLWSQSLIAEVYTAGASYVVFTLLALLWWDSNNSKWALFTAGLLGGLSIGVHMSVALLAPAILFFLLLHRDRGWMMWRTAVLGAVSGLATTVLLFLLIEWNNPTASYFNSVIEPSHSAWGYDLGQMDDPLEHLLFSWQGRQFQYLMFSDIETVMPQQAVDYWDNLGHELTMPLIVMAVLGAIWLMLRRFRIAILLLAALILQLFYFFNYEIWDLYVFYIPSYILLTLLAIAGLGALIDICGWGFGKLTGEQQAAKAVLDVFLATLVLAFAVWPILKPHWEGLLNGQVAFEFDEYPLYDPNLKLIVAATVAELPENAVVFTDWDKLWPYYYVAFLEQSRTDLTFIETNPADDQDGLARSAVAFVIEKVSDQPIFFEERQFQLEQLEGLNMSPVRIGPTRLFKVTQNQP